MTWKKIILIGDSITQYGYSKEGKWVGLLSNYVQRRCDVINRGYAGYTSEDLKAIVPTIFEEFNAKDIVGVTIMLGSNDSCSLVSVENYRKNLKEMLDHLINKLHINKSGIVLISPPRKYSKNNQANIDESVRPYAQVCVDLAKEFETNSLDFFQRMIEYGEKNQHFNELLTDGLHLAQPGAELLFEELLPFVNKIIKSVQLAVDF